MKQFKSPLGAQIERFLTHKRSLGFVYHREEAFLREFDRLVLRTQHDGPLSESVVRAYLSGFGQPSREHRLTLIRQLARFLTFEEPHTFVPPTRFLGIHRQHHIIRVLSREEASRFLDACDRLPSTSSFVRRVVHSTALRLLLLTGMRCGEAIAIRNEDVDLSQSLLTVQGKYAKVRFVPIAVDLTQRLQDYRKTVAATLKSSRPSDPFFPCADGRRPSTRKSLYQTFRYVLTIAGIQHCGRGEGPRLHDLRHHADSPIMPTFAQRFVALQPRRGMPRFAHRLNSA